MAIVNRGHVPPPPEIAGVPYDQGLLTIASLHKALLNPYFWGG